MFPLRHLRGLPTALLLLLGLPATVAAQPFVYALNAKGRLSINNTLLDDLPGDFDPDDLPIEDPEDAWVDLVVVGADRYALRLDGRIYKNGALLHNTLPFSDEDEGWTALSVTPTAVLAIREDGALGVDGAVPFDFATSGFRFLDLLGADPNVFSLRSDGAVFLNQTGTPKFQFDAADLDRFEDGEILATEWMALAIHPVSGDLFALRRDGKIFSGDPDAPGSALPGTLVGALPEPNLPPELDDLFFDLEFASDGTWYVLEGDGRVFSPANFNTPLVDFDGDASDPDETFVDLATSGTEFWAIRGDGKLFKHPDTASILDLESEHYRRIAISTSPPDLSSFKNAPPVTATYQTTALPGDPVAIPVVATDSDKRAADLVVIFPPIAEQPTNFPPGFGFIPSPGSTSFRGTLSGTAPALNGGYSMILFVDDGVNEPKKLTYKLKVVLPDTDPLKDKKPVFAKPKKPQVVVTGAPPPEVLELPIFAVDPDGDPITLAVDPETPLPAGATFVLGPPGTGVFSWTADPIQAGKHPIAFLATSGTKTVKLKVKFKVVNGLIF